MRVLVITSTPTRSHPVRALIAAYRLLIVSLWTHADLIWQVARRDIVVRYRGSFLGVAWSLVTPVLTLALYTFLFGVVFRTRWGTGAPEGRVEYALILFVGLILHGFLAECLTRAPSLLFQHPHLIKRVVFPVHILAWALTASALFNASVGLMVWAIATTIAGHPPGLTLLWLPLVLAPLVLIGAGLTWMLAATGVFLRDINHVTGLAAMALLFLAPILYRLDAVPPEFRTVLLLNPLTFIVEQARAILIWRRSPDLFQLALALTGAYAFAGLGLAWFQRLRPGFSDVL